MAFIEFWETKKDKSQYCMKKDEGYNFFYRKEFVKAVEAYTCCINSFPEDCPDDLSTAYFNRSAALYSLHSFGASLKDINEGIKICKNKQQQQNKKFENLINSTGEHDRIEQLGSQKSGH